LSFAALHITRIDTDDVAIAETFVGVLGATVSGTVGGEVGCCVAAEAAAGDPPPQEVSASTPAIANGAINGEKRRR
jgi:hypothetical protein